MWRPCMPRAGSLAFWRAVTIHPFWRSAWKLISADCWRIDNSPFFLLIAEDSCAFFMTDWMFQIVSSYFDCDPLIACLQALHTEAIHSVGLRRKLLEWLECEAIL